MDPKTMTNKKLAWELEKPCGGRENGIEFDLLREAARRLRTSIPAALYKKAWEECQAWRDKSLAESIDEYHYITKCVTAHDAARKEYGIG